MNSSLRVLRRDLSVWRSSRRIQAPLRNTHARMQRVQLRHSSSERLSLEQEKELAILRESMFKDSTPKPKLALPLLFSAGIVGAVFGWAAISTNEETEYWKQRVLHIPRTLPWVGVSTSGTMYQEWRQAKGREWQQSFDEFVKKTQTLPQSIRGLAQYSYYYVAQSWVNLTEGKEMTYKLVGAFTAVYILSFLPMTRNLARKYFAHDPLSGRVASLFTSQFGHAGLIHLGVNSFALIGFGEFAWSYLRHKQTSNEDRLDEATSGWHFLAFHLAAGTFSALLSHVIATRVVLPRMIAQLSKSTAEIIPAQARILPSTGASGAIWASLMVTALGWPHTTVTLIFFPFFPISIGTGVFGLVALDVVGLIRGWRFFDHAAHLGGAAFGWAYFYYGPAQWDWWRRLMLEWYPPKTE